MQPFINWEKLMKHERICVICNSAYSYCPICGKYDDFPRWMFMFDNENCKKIWEVLNDYKAGIMDKEAAKVLLGGLDLSGRDHFNEGFLKTLNEILPVEKVEEKVETVKSEQIKVDEQPKKYNKNFKKFNSERK